MTRERDVALAACSEANGELRALKLKHELEAELEAVRTPPRDHAARADRAEREKMEAEAREAEVRAEFAALRRRLDAAEARAASTSDSEEVPRSPAAALNEEVSEVLREADRSVRQNIRRVETFESGDAPQTPPRSRGLRRRVAALAEERDALLANAEKRISSLTEQLARVTQERDAARPVVETRGRATQTKVYGLQQRPRSAPPSPRGSSDDEDRGKWRRAEDELNAAEEDARGRRGLGGERRRVLEAGPRRRRRPSSTCCGRPRRTPWSRRWPRRKGDARSSRPSFLTCGRSSRRSPPARRGPSPREKGLGRHEGVSGSP